MEKVTLQREDFTGWISNKGFTKSYNGFCGCDIYMTHNAGHWYRNPHQIRIATLQGIAYTIGARQPMSPWGNADPRAFRRKKRSITGVIVPIEFPTISPDNKGLDLRLAQGLEIHLKASNEYGKISGMSLIGVKINNFMLEKEKSYTFTAEGMIPWRVIDD